MSKLQNYLFGNFRLIGTPFGIDTIIDKQMRKILLIIVL